MTAVFKEIAMLRRRRENVMHKYHDNLSHWLKKSDAVQKRTAKSKLQLP